MDAPEIILKKGSITKLKVDAMVVPCDVHLSNIKANNIIQDVIESANRDLIKEITSIGYCEIGNAVITKGYNLNANRLIFMPYCDIEDENYKANFSQLHLSFRSIFNLASLYEVNSISIPVFFRLSTGRRSLKDKILNLEILDIIFGQKEGSGVKHNEIEDIVTSVISEYVDTNIKKLYLFK